MIDLNEVRRVFSEFLATDPEARWRMDAALAHVAEFCYRRGMEDANKQGEQQS